LTAVTCNRKKIKSKRNTKENTSKHAGRDKIQETERENLTLFECPVRVDSISPDALSKSTAAASTPPVAITSWHHQRIRRIFREHKMHKVPPIWFLNTTNLDSRKL